MPGVIQPVSRILNLPEGVQPLCVVLLGYPDEHKRPRSQYNEKRVHWQQYQPRKRRAKIKNAKDLD